jgi:hypothetical protein
VEGLITSGRSGQGISKWEVQLSCELGIGSWGESIKVLGEDEAKGRKTVEMVEQSTLTGALESQRGVAVGVVKKLQAVLVGVLGCLRPEGLDEPCGIGAQEAAVVEDELLDAGDIGVGRRVLPIDADAPGCEGTSAISVG